MSRLLFGPRRERGRHAADDARSLQNPWAALLASQGYADVDASRPETAMQSVAVGSAIDLIASLGSELPIHVYSGQGRDRQTWATPSYLLDPAGDGYGLPDWIYQMLVSYLLRGNLYGNVLDRARSGYPIQVEWLYPDAVRAQLDKGSPQWTVNGNDFPARDMWHNRVYAMPGQLLGLSPITMHARTIGVSLTSTEFGLQWFRDGAHPSSLLTNSETLTPEQAQTAKDRFMAALRGRREPLVLGKGWDWKQIQITPEESQFLQTQGLSAAECARIYGPGMAEILGYESGGSLTYATVEGRMQHLLTLSVNKWLRRAERIMTAMLPAPRYVKLDRDAILQSTTLDRYRAHESALKNQWKVVNEVRDDEDMQPVPWGDKPNTVAGAAPAAGDNPPEPDEPPNPAGGN